MTLPKRAQLPQLRQCYRRNSSTSASVISVASCTDQAKVVPIEFSESSDHNVYTLTIPGILEEKGVMKRDADGKPLHTVPAMDLWGNKITYVDNVVFKYHDKGIGEWDLSGHQANVKEINTTKTMWEQKQMLVQHGDMSGTWTAEQRKMIEAMGMKSE